MKNLSKEFNLIIALICFISILSCSKDEGIQANPEATSVELINGSNQSAIIESELTNPIQVLVRDQNGVPFAGAIVAFSVTEGGILIEGQTNYNTSATVITDSNGIASVSSWLLGPRIGTQTLTATVFKSDGVTNLTNSPLIINAIAAGNSCVLGESFLSIPINDNSSISSDISITEAFILSDINVIIDITHTYISDLEIYLFNNANTATVALTLRNGYPGDNNYTNTVFDDQANISITDGTPPFTGVYKPVGDLSDFNGVSSGDTWTLAISDLATDDIGTLNYWAIEICRD